MKIMKTNMLLSDNKMAKENAAQVAVTAPAISAVQPQQASMNALMFQGMQNLMANPKLAMGVGVMNDDAEPQKDETAKSYVAPFSSNVSFQGKSNAKILALASWMAIAPAVASLYSCKDETWQKQEVIVDTSALAAAQQQTNAYLAELLAQGKLSQDKMDAFFNAFLSFSEMYSQEASSMADFRAALLNYIANDATIQNLILQELIQQGMDQKEAYAYFQKAVQDIINELKAGNMTLAEALAALNKIGQGVDDINSLLQKWYNDFVQAVADFKAYLKDAYEQLKEINKNGKITNAQLANIQGTMSYMSAELSIQNQSLREIIKNQNEMKQITQEGLRILIAQGYTEQEILSMGFAKANALLTEILNKNTSMDAKIAVIVDLINSGRLEEAYKEITELLNDIKVGIDNLNENFMNFYNQYKKDQAANRQILGGIYMNGRIQINQIAFLTSNVAAMRMDLRNIQGTLDELLEAVKNGTQIDYERFEEMFKLLNLHQQASAAEIIAAINEFKGTYIDKEDQEITLLENLAANVNDIKIFLANNTGDNKDVIEAIANLTNAVNAGNADISDLLKIANQKLEELIKAVNDLRADVNKLAGDQYKLLAQMNTKLGNIEAAFPDLKNQLATIITNQKLAESTRQQILAKLGDLEAAIAKLEAMAGKGLTKDDLDDLMGKYGDDLKAFLSGLHAETMEGIHDALEYQRQGLKILADILDAIKAMDKTAPDYNAKLDEIIELMKNFKFECHCQCDCDDDDKIHEGIIGIID